MTPESLEEDVLVAKPVVVGRNVLFPGAVVIGICTTVVVILMWGWQVISTKKASEDQAAALLTLTATVTKLTETMSELREGQNKIEDILTDRWTGTNMKMWCLEMLRLNPTISLPDPWDIIQRLPTKSK